MFGLRIDVRKHVILIYEFKLEGNRVNRLKQVPNNHYVEVGNSSFGIFFSVMRLTLSMNLLIGVSM